MTTTNTTTGVVYEVDQRPEARAVLHERYPALAPLHALARGLGHRFIVAAMYGAQPAWQATAANEDQAAAVFAMANARIAEVAPNSVTAWVLAVAPALQTRLAALAPTGGAQ